VSLSTDVTESKPNGRIQRLQAFRHEHAKAEIAVFFAAGFLFDIVTLSRIDDLFTLVQQAVYLVVLAGLMVLEERYRAGIAAPPRWLQKAWRFSEDVIHFLFGSLLSSFTLFYLKSSSGLSSIVFMSILGGLLVANELPRFREWGPIVRFALLSLCLTSYLALLLPVIFGFLSKWLFVTAVVLACGALAWLVRKLRVWTHDAPTILEHVAAPAFGMQMLLVLAYFLGAIPPVPLSVQFIGIYHEVIPPGRESVLAAAEAAPVESEPETPAPERSSEPTAPESQPEAAAPEIPPEAALAEGEPGAPLPDSEPVAPLAESQPEAAPLAGGPKAPPRARENRKTVQGYQLKHLRPWWKVWQNGDQLFEARPGDVVYCFARVFAPNRFRDAIYVHWWIKGKTGGWLDQGRAQLNISGGRGDGFRAFATKKNYQPGRWRVEIETSDGRNIGGILFDLTSDPSSGERTFSVDGA
jgi:Protein of unknown function (DUF2914)